MSMTISTIPTTPTCCVWPSPPSLVEANYRTWLPFFSGRNFETKAYEDAIAEDSFRKLKNGILAFVNETHFDRITMILRSAGFISSDLISGARMR